MERQSPRPPYRIGLALSGGGARGFAHIGVYKAMEELGIRPDIISGTSAGAITGAMFASGHSAEESMALFKEKKLLDFARPAVSRTGLMNMNGLEKHLADFIKAKRMEELRIPLVITATNLNLGIPTHFREGEIIPRIIASCCVPIVFSPITIDGYQYVDGGVFMNLPVRPIRDLCEVVIGVHIDPVEPNSHVKNMLQLAERSFHMGILSNMNEDTRLCDVVIIPKHISQYNMFDLSNMDILREEGYKQARVVFDRPKVKQLLGIR